MIARFINPLIQYGTKEYELIIFDNDVIVDRRHAKFSEETPEEEMEAFAQSVIDSLKITVEEINIDTPIDNPE